MNECISVLFCKFTCICVSIIINITMKYYVCSKAFCTVYFDQRCNCRHNNRSFASKLFCCKCNALCMISC